MDPDSPTGLIHARWVWTPQGVREDATIAVFNGIVTNVRPARAGDPPRLDGVVVPGLVNAHTHLELTGIPMVTGEGLAGWVGALATERARGAEGDAHLGARTLVDLGAAAACDVSNTGETASAMADAGLRGVVQHELLGHDFDRTHAALAIAADGVRTVRGIPVRPTAHGPHSTPRAVLEAVGRIRSRHPASIHVAEHTDERDFLHGSGPFVDLMAWWNLDITSFDPPRMSPVAYLHELGLLGRSVLAVHCVDIDREDIQRLAATRTPMVTCPRSNLHIGGRLADLQALVGAGIPIALGTDSTASCPDLDVLGEIPLVADAFRDIPIAVWLAGCTHVAATVLGLVGVGSIEVGTEPGLLLLEGTDMAGLGKAVPSRRWLARPKGPST